MKKILASLSVGLSVSGCASIDLSKLVPAAQSFEATITGTTKTETDLIAAFQAENNSLKFISGQDYNCGDPKSPIYRYYASAKNPGTLVTQEHVNNIGLQASHTWRRI